MHRSSVAWLALVLAIFVAAVLLAAPWRRAKDGLRLADGTRIRVLDAKVGGAQFTTEKPWHRLARRILPRQWQQWIPTASSGSCSSGSNSITLYLAVLDPSGLNLAAIPQAWSTTEAVDDTGFGYGRNGGSCTFGSNPVRVQGISLQAYPRRQGSFALIFHAPDDKELGRLRVKNPLPGPFPDWQPEPMPITRTNGPVALTLQGLREQGEARYRWIRADFDLKSANPLWEKARVKYWTFQDATGNQGQRLSPQEPAWKTLATVNRQRPQDFRPDEICVVPRLAVPGPGEFTALGVQTNLGAIEVRVQAFAGPGTLHLTNRFWLGMSTNQPRPNQGGWSSTSDSTTSVESFGSADPFFVVQVTGLGNLDEVSFRLTGDNGWSDFQQDAPDYQSDATSHRYRVKVKPPAPVENVGLEVFVNRGLAFEFVVNPAELASAPSAKK
jgi:hypothetical protein